VGKERTCKFKTYQGEMKMWQVASIFVLASIILNKLQPGRGIEKAWYSMVISLSPYQVSCQGSS